MEKTQSIILVKSKEETVEPQSHCQQNIHIVSAIEIMNASNNSNYHKRTVQKNLQ